jgi:hypothetical protein
MREAAAQTAADLTVRRLRWVMALCTGLLAAATWPLWLPETPVPQIPWTRWAARLPRGPGEFALVANLAVFLLLQFLDIRRTWLRCGLNAYFFLASVPLLLLLDQHRLQPWVWQMLIGAGIIAMSRSSRVTLVCLRWLTISVYFWSALSKFDRAFVEGHGQVLLSGLADSVGLSTDIWSESLRRTLAAAMPVGEFGVAILLIAWRTRRLGLWAAIAMHAALILALGPTGLGHEWGVLIWNGFFIASAWLLFGNVAAGEPQASAWRPRSTHPQAGAGGSSSAWGSPSAWGAPVLTVLAVLLPALSLVGWWDWWPSWAVYSSRPAVVRMLVHEDETGRLPPTLQPHVGPAPPLSQWRPVNLDGWSFASCWCPMYPQQRYRLAVIAAVAEQAGIEPRIEIRSTPDRWTGRRGEQTLSADALPQQLQAYWCNTSPRRR